MNILVINVGSSSLKFEVFQMPGELVLAKGHVERIGMDAGILTYQAAEKEELREVSEIVDHTIAMAKVIEMLVDKQYGIFPAIDYIHAVGHRVVHGGEAFPSSVVVTDEVKREIKRLYDLAPLHNPAHMMGIEAVELKMPGVPQVAVFDTAFHQTMPASSYLYPIPRMLHRRHQIRRYGFHGTSHDYVSGRAATYLNRELSQLKMVTCHIGNGVSCTAIKDGKSFDTSMGLTPLEGPMMGSRSGDLDPAVVSYIMAKEDLTIGEVDSLLNRLSGLLAISGLSSDMRDIGQAMNEGDRNALLAFEMYEYRIRKYIGAYTAAMNGLDVLVFTAGVGENSALLRERICQQLSFFGVQIDDELNHSKSREERRISSQQSKVEVLVIPTNEELVIAKDTYTILAESVQATDDEPSTVNR